jgi:hypothetical protein
MVLLVVDIVYPILGGIEKMIVKTPSGIEYCEFSVDESVFKIKLIKSGCTVNLDRKVIPYLKKFLNLLEPLEEKT